MVNLYDSITIIPYIYIYILVIFLTITYYYSKLDQDYYDDIVNYGKYLIKLDQVLLDKIELDSEEYSIITSNETFYQIDQYEITIVANETQSTTYNTEKQFISYEVHNSNGKIDDSTLDKLFITQTINVEYKNSKTNVITEPINANEYKVTISILDEQNFNNIVINSDSNCNITFTINRIKVKTVNTVIEADYTDFTSRDKDTMLTYIKDNTSFVLENGDPIPYSNFGFTIQGMHNGVYKYGNISINLPTTTNVVGSTYVVTIYLNAESASNYSITNTLIFKYKTAIVNGTYYTIEDAINLDSTDTITLIGDYSGASTYVMTSFSKLASYGNYYGTSSFTLDSKNLVVPADNTLDGLISTSHSNVYSALVIPSGIKLSVTGGHTVTIAGKIGNNSQITGRGVIMNDGTIDIIEGELFSYGYIKSSSSTSTGIIYLRNNTTATDVMRIFDFPGGNTASNIYKYALPTNAWSMHNISCKIQIEGYAIYKIHVHIEITGVTIDEPYTIVNGSSSETPLFRASSEESYILKYATNSKKTPSATDLYSITGGNQINGQKDVLEINGNYVDNSFAITKSGFTMSTNTSVACPLGFQDIILQSGTLTLSNSDYLLLPGTTVTINENATLVINEGVDMSFETWNNIQKVKDAGTCSNVFSNYCVDTDDAKLILYGTININKGSIGGLIVPGKENITLNLSGIDLNTDYYSLKNAVGTGKSGYLAYRVQNLPAAGYITNDENVEVVNKVNFTTTSYTSVKIGDNYYWKGELGGADNDGNMTINAVEVSSCIAAGTLITMADGTQKKVEDIKAGDKVLVFNHEEGKYDISTVMFNAHDNLEWRNYRIINLLFSDGTILKIINEHTLFDTTLNKYVIINEQTMNNYINHNFYNINFINNNYVRSDIKLEKVFITEEYTGIFNPLTYYHMNAFTNGLLSMPGEIENLINIFEYDTDLKYSESSMKYNIDKYGLYTYEDLKEYYSEEILNALPIAYVKIQVEKGITTLDEVRAIIDMYIDLIYGSTT